MQFCYLILILIFSLGCQTRPVSTMDCLSERTPASSAEMCSGVFLTRIKIPNTSDMQNFFRDLENFKSSAREVLKRIEAGYLVENTDIYNIEHAQVPDVYRHLVHVTTGKVLAQRLKLKDSTTKVLTELGYEMVSDQLMPPRYLSSLYSRVFERLAKGAEQAGLAESDVLWPAFLFSRRNAQTNAKELLFVRPGMDPLPKASEGWSLSLRGGELSAVDFNRMLQERKFLLEPGMFFHDMGHIVDFIERPQYMVAFREYSEKKHKALNDPAVPPAVLPHLLGQVAIRGDIERYMNEWIYLPSEKNIPRIRALISDLNFSSPGSLESLQVSYRKLSSPELLQKAKDFLKERYTLFSSHGGGARDFSNERNLFPWVINNGFAEILGTEGTAITSSKRALDDKEVQLREPDKLYRRHEAPGFFDRLTHLVNLKEGKEKAPEISTFLNQQSVKMGYTDLMSFLDLQIAYHLAEVQYRVQMALHYKMTPEQIAKDTALLYDRDGWENYRKTRTSAYYSTYRPYTVQWVLGFDAGRRNPNYVPIKWPPTDP